MSEEEQSSGARGGGQAANDDRLRRALLWVGAVSTVSAVAAFVVVRATLGRAHVDPTTDRIQDLIDEANQLLKSLDASKRS